MDTISSPFQLESFKNGFQENERGQMLIRRGINITITIIHII